MAAQDRVQAHRDRIREQGAPQFLAEAHRQSVVLADNLHAAGDQAFVDAISYSLDDE
ncbi:antitoxin MazE-like protein [Nocardia sp. NPDC004604]|uniref:antitoxin MazE-like protein n=1 Tax=Nocardia sp. NPDC004604 TaxID=3157013 RepID=UPI0033B8B6CC